MFDPSEFECIDERVDDRHHELDGIDLIEFDELSSLDDGLIVSDDIEDVPF